LHHWLVVRLHLIGLLALVWMLTFSPAPAAAHANLARSEPPANASLTEPPGEIRLWFTETLEPRYSRIILLDASGAEVPTAPGSIDSADVRQMVLAPGDLPSGVYTVSWRSLSAADGHVTQGSFAFGIGTAPPTSESTPTINEAIPVESAAVRAFHLGGMALLVGSIGFWRFVWQPTRLNAVPSKSGRRLRLLMMVGWIWLGLALFITLAAQTAAAAGNLTVEAVWDVVTGTTYGVLWGVRLLLWLLIGLLLRREDRLWLALTMCAGLLLAHSLTSHAAASADMTVAAAVDGLHLLAACLWLGGLAAFALVLFRASFAPEVVARLAAGFSNYIRAAVAALAVTGLYAAWLQVGSAAALVNTVYGRALLIKIVLFAPLLMTAAVNLLITQRRLAGGRMGWIGRLRGLIGIEIALLLGMLTAAGVMTAINPARAVQAERDALAAAEAATIQAEPYFEMQMTDDLMAHLEIVPGVVGENTFHVTLADLVTGAAIEDASRIRLRFQNRDQNLGESELRPQLGDQSEYVASGSNLSIPGDWRVRMTVQRPGEFDTVLDFDVNIPAATPPASVAWPAAIPAWERGAAALLAGLTLLGTAGFFVARAGLRIFSAVHVLSGFVAAVGLIALMAGTQILAGTNAAIAVHDVWARPANEGETTAVYLTIDNGTTDAVSLMGSQSPDAERVELHQTMIENDFAHMMPLDVLVIRAGETVRIEPPGTHLMLIELNRDLVEGDEIPLTLTFDTGESKAVTAQVQMTAPEQP
jgi:copper transport protein